MTIETLPYVDVRIVNTRLDAVLRLGLSNRPDDRIDYPTDSALGRATRFHSGLVAILRAYAIANKEIISNADLSANGRQSRLLVLGHDYLSHVDSLTNQLTMRPAIENILNRANEAINKAMKDWTEGVEFDREAEARAMLYAMTPVPRLEAGQEIIESKEAVGIAAIFNAPKFNPVFDAQTLEDWKHILVASKNATAIQNRDDANDALYSVDAMIADAKKMIADTSGIDLRPVTGFAALDAANAAG